MALKRVNIAPIALGNAAADLLNCNVTSLSGPVGMSMSQPFLIVYAIHFVNNDNAAQHTFRLFKGLTGGSSATKTVIGYDKVILAADTYDWSGEMRLDAADFLSGYADTANKIILEIDAELGISG